MPAEPSNPIILYDGVCGLCNRIVQFILRRDSQDRFRFATLQSETARALLQKHGMNVEKLETVYLVVDHGGPLERILSRSTASIGIFRELGSFWRVWAGLFGILPRPLRDWGYDLVAKYRYRIFGRYDSCLLPEEKHRHKFIDI